MKLKTNIKISAPATISNFGIGLNCLGLALQLPSDEIIATEADTPGIHIQQIINNKANLLLDTSSNSAGIAAKKTLEYLKETHGVRHDIGLNLKLTKKIPMGFGLGSSVASAVAGAMAVNESFTDPLPKRQLLSLITAGETDARRVGKIHTIAPCLIGGMVLTSDHKTLDIHRLPNIKGLQIVVIYKKKRHNINTSPRVSFNQTATIQQVANAASLIQALHLSNLDLLAQSLQNPLGEELFIKEIPHFNELKQLALDQKALNFNAISNDFAFFSICKNTLEANNVAEAITHFLAEKKIETRVLISDINQEGAYKN